MSDAKKSQQVIRPVDLSQVTRAENNLGTVQRVANESASRSWVWGGLLVLVMLALGVIFLLPRAVNKQVASTPVHAVQNEVEKTDSPKKQVSELAEDTEHAESSAQATSNTNPDEQTNNQAQAKAEVEAMLTRLIDLEATLNKHAVKRWAQEEFSQAVERGRVGDELFRQKQFVQAKQPFQEALDMLQVLRERIDPTLQQALERGEQALLQGDQLQAQHQFELAAAINGNNVRTRNGLQRTKTITQLIALLQRASSFESHSQLLQAKSTYQEAVKLDPLSEQAQSALLRVNNKLNDQAFQQIMATAYAALDSGQYSDARAAFKSAQKTKPNSSQPSAGLAKVAQAVRAEKINNLLFEAEHFVGLQQWQQASSSYEKILQLDSQHALAQKQMQLNKQRASLQKEISAALDTTDQLHKQNVLQAAEQLLTQVGQLDSPGSNLTAQAQQLQQRVNIASTPITITLESDGNTQVTVYKVARLGVFRKHQLQLRPGPYVAVGTRSGFRDVRINIQVDPSNANAIYTLRCDEPI